MAVQSDSIGGSPKLFPVDLKEGEPIYDNNDMATMIPDATGGEAMSASFSLGAESTPINSINRINEIFTQQKKDFDNRETELSVEELNAKFPHSKGIFREPKTLGVAEIIDSRVRKRKELEEVVAKGPQGAAYSVGNFVSGMAPHVIDPLNIGAGVAISLATPVLVGALGVSAATATRLGLSASITKATAGQAFARGAVEGVIGNALVEPLDVVASLDDGAEVSLAKSATNIFAGAIAFPGLMFAGKKAFRLAKSRSSNVDFNHGVEHIETNGKLAHSQLSSDKKVNLDFVYKSLVRESSESFHVRPEELRIKSISSDIGKISKYVHEQGYSYTKLDLTSKTNRMFSVGKNLTESLSSGKQVIGDWRGQGTYMTDNLTVANGLAAGATKRVKGAISDIDLGKKNILDIDLPMPKKYQGIIKEFIKDGRQKIDFDKIDKAETAREALDELSDQLEIHGYLEESLDGLNELFRKSGLDGFLENGKSKTSGITADNNRVFLFNNVKSKVNQVLEPDKSFVNKMSPSEVRETANQLHSFKSDVLYNPELESVIKNRESAPYKKPTVAEISNVTKELDETVKFLDTEGKIDASDKEVLKVIKELRSQKTKVDKLLKEAQVCVRINGE